MTLDPQAVSDGFQKSGGYYLAALVVVAIGVVSGALVSIFWLFKAAMDARVADLKEDLSKRDAQLAAKDKALEDLHAKFEGRQERLDRDVDRVVEVQTALERLLPKRRKPPDGAP